MLIVNPKIFITKNVPISETGIVAAGINVDRGFCKNKKITRRPSTIESSSVIMTSLIDSLDEGRRVERHGVMHARREILSKLVQFGP